MSSFHDGTPFDAAAVKANLEHVVNPDTKSLYAAALLGGEAYKGTEVIDDLTVRIDLSRPYAPLLQGLSTAYLGFYSPQVLATAADKLVAGGPDVTVGTGPYKFESYVDGQEITFTKNPIRLGPGKCDHAGAAHPDPWSTGNRPRTRCAPGRWPVARWTSRATSRPPTWIAALG